MTETAAAPDTLDLAPDRLTLVVVSPDYFRTGRQNELMPNGDDESRTYYATTSRAAYGPAWATIIDPADRGRLSAWSVDPEFDALNLPSGIPHNGWNILREYLSIATDSIQHVDHNATGDALVSDALTSPRFSQEDVDRLVREAREAAKREADDALEDFKRAANARAVEYAEQNGLCSEFERCMEDIGLLGREEWHDENDDTYRVTFTVSVDVQARDEYDAHDRARSALYESLEYPLDQTIKHHDTTVL
jgi:hypothetical protein